MVEGWQMAYAYCPVDAENPLVLGTNDKHNVQVEIVNLEDCDLSLRISFPSPVSVHQRLG